MEGWISLHRKFTEWEWYDDLNTKSLFIHCLLKANHKAKKWRGISVKKGSFITSRNHLSIELNMSEQKVRTALKKLESTNEITIKSTKLNTLISIVNWDKYQDSNQPNNQRATNEQPTSNQRVTTTNNDNKDNNEDKSIVVGEPTPPPKKTIIEIQTEKKEWFKNWLIQEVSKTNYSDQKDELNKFYEYWVEAGPRSKKLRWEKEKAFDIKRRLDTWFKNNYNEGSKKARGNNSNGSIQPTKTEEVEEWLRQKMENLDNPKDETGVSFTQSFNQ